MSAGLPLAEFTALLARQLAESAALAERRQRDDYVALAADAGGTLETYLERWVGCTETEQRQTAARYLAEVVAPLVARPVDEAMVRFDGEGADRLVAHFGESIRPAIEPGAETGTWAIERYRFEQVVLDKLRGDAEARYRDARLLLRTGVPHTQIRGAKLSAKVFLEDDGNGAITARVASAESAKDCCEAISTLTVDFSVGAFPTFE